MTTSVLSAQPLHFDASSQWSEEQWRYEGLEAQHLIYTISLSGDTVIQGQSFAKLIRLGTITITPLLDDPPPPPMILPINAYAGALRMDSVSGHWWMVLPGEGQEQLLYHWDLAVGDTVEGTYGDCGGAATVTAMDEVWFNGRFHRRFILNNGFRHITEGIGASSGLFGHLCPFYEEYGCLQTYSLGDAVWQVQGCDGITTDLPEPTTGPEGPKVFPNPSSGIVSLGETSAGERIRVFDLYGNLVAVVSSDAMGIVDLQGLLAGTYLLRIRSGTFRVVLM